MRRTSSSACAGDLLILPVGREDHAGDRVAAAERLGADLARTAGQSPHVVQPGAGIEQVLLPKSIHFPLALQVGAELQEQGLPIERLAQELPRAGAIRFEPLGAARGSRGRDDDGCGGAEPAVAAEGSADLEPVHVGHLGVEDDQVRLGRSGSLQRLLPGVGPDDRVAVGTQDALQRPRGPFLVVRDEHERRAGGLISIRHVSSRGVGTAGVVGTSADSRTRAARLKFHKSLVPEHITRCGLNRRPEKCRTGATGWMLARHDRPSAKLWWRQRIRLVDPQQRRAGSQRRAHPWHKPVRLYNMGA